MTVIKVKRGYLFAIVLGALALSGCGRENADWKSATAADSIESYQQFLEQHPSSSNAEQARSRIKQLADDRDWQVAAAADTRDAYQQFVAQHADSKWAQEARIRIENFAQAGVTGAAVAAATNGATADASTAPPVANAQSPVSEQSAVSAPTSKPAAHAPGNATPATVVAKHGTSKTASAHTVASNRSHKTEPKSASVSHVVQLGAFRSKAAAQSQWKVLTNRFPSELKTLKPRFVAVKSKSSNVYRLQVAVSSASGAKVLCTTLHKHSQPCVAVPGSGSRVASATRQRLTKIVTVSAPRA